MDYPRNLTTSAENILADQEPADGEYSQTTGNQTIRNYVASENANPTDMGFQYTQISDSSMVSRIPVFVSSAVTEPMCSDLELDRTGNVINKHNASNEYIKARNEKDADRAKDFAMAKYVSEDLPISGEGRVVCDIGLKPTIKDRQLCALSADQLHFTNLALSKAVITTGNLANTVLDSATADRGVIRKSVLKQFSGDFNTDSEKVPITTLDSVISVQENIPQHHETNPGNLHPLYGGPPSESRISLSRSCSDRNSRMSSKGAELHSYGVENKASDTIDNANIADLDFITQTILPIPHTKQSEIVHKNTLKVHSCETDTEKHTEKLNSNDVEAGKEAKSKESCLVFYCGSCLRNFETIGKLHDHLMDHDSGGSYHYDNLLRTAFPRYDTVCAGTQTDLDILENIQKTVILTTNENYSSNVPIEQDISDNIGSSMIKTGNVYESSIKTASMNNGKGSECTVIFTTTNDQRLEDSSKIPFEDKDHVSARKRTHSVVDVQSEINENKISKRVLHEPFSDSDGCEDDGELHEEYSENHIENPDGVGNISLLVDPYEEINTETPATPNKGVKSKTKRSKNKSLKKSKRCDVKRRQGGRRREALDTRVKLGTNGNRSPNEHLLDKADGVERHKSRKETVVVKTEESEDTGSSKPLIKMKIKRKVGTKIKVARRRKEKLIVADTEDDIVKRKRQTGWKSVTATTNDVIYAKKVVQAGGSEQYMVDGEYVENMCLKCKLVFTSKEYFNNHMLRHDGVFPCDRCCKVFPEMQHLKEHTCKDGITYGSRDIDTHFCQFCNIIFTELVGFKAHICRRSSKLEEDVSVLRQYDPNDTPTMLKELPEINEDLEKKAMPNGHEPVTCQICGHVFNNESNLFAHSYIHKFKFRCTYCEGYLVTESALEDHEFNCMNRKFWHCHLCRKRFTSKGYQRIHMLLHEGKKDFQCEKCGQAFVTKWYLKTHKESCVHGADRERLHQCTVCQKRFFDKCVLSSHMNTVHSDNKPFVCEVCGTSFKYSCNLKKHLPTHDAVRTRYPCSMCDTTFNSMAASKRHMKIHKGQMNEQCSACGKTFMDKWNLKAHMRQHTGEKPYTCDVCGRGFAHNVSRKNHMASHHGIPRT